VVGASGSGKSTLLNLMAGLDTPTTGRIALFGRDLAALRDDVRSDLRLQRIGFVFQTFNLFPTFTVAENVAWPLKFLRVRWREAEQRASTALHEMGIPPAAHGRFTNEMSGGEQQRIAIARALVTNPRVLLADEPTGNLDSRTGQVVLDVLRALHASRNLTIVLVTHSAFAASYADRTIELLDGWIVTDTTTAADHAVAT
jgi:putative ABC transport system ATP-binding protein